MFYEEREYKASSPLNLRTLGSAFALHLVLFGLFWVAGCVMHRTPEAVIPIDMTIVPPWAQQDPDDPNPDPNPPPKEEEQAKPKPTPKPDPPPKLEPDQDAVEKIPEKKKRKEFKKGELKQPDKKDDKKKDDKKAEKKFVKTGKLIKNPPPVKLPPGKGTSRDKPLSQAEIAKALAAGARYGASNQLAENEEQRCLSLINRRFREVWDVPGGYEGRVVQLTIRFGSGGRIVGYSIARSSGIATLDRSVLEAAKRAQYVSGLSVEFLRKYPELTIEMIAEGK